MKRSPKIIFSLNAAPLMNNRWKQGNRLEETLYMTALSVLYAHVWYREVELLVDRTAYPYLYMLPCKVRIIDLPEQHDLWMKAKIKAIAKQDRPFVHLDTDVFITKPIDFEFSSCILERKEASYLRHYKQQLKFFNPLVEDLTHWHNDLGYSFNCGVLGFADMDLKAEFIDAYYRLEQAYLLHKDDYAKYKQLGYEPCIVLEQYNLACLLNSKGIKPKLLLPMDSVKQQATRAKEIGYNHLFGVTKYKQGVVEEIKYQLYKIFPYWYAQVKIAIEAHLKTEALAQHL